MTDDLFDTPGEFHGIVNGRYRYPPPPGHRDNPRGWMRMTNLASAFSDQERLTLWLEAKTMVGLRAGEGVLFDEWMAENLDGLDWEQVKKLANSYAERAREMADADAGARKGTARHKMVQTYLEDGIVTGTRTMRRQLTSLTEALEAYELDPIPGWVERRVWNPIAGGTMGTLDMAVSCRRTGQRGVLDLKTQARFWTFQEIAAQQYGYDSAPWVWQDGEWLRAPLWDLLGHPNGEFAGRRVALLAHMPTTAELPVHIIEVPLDYGKDVLECAARNVELRSIGRSVAEGRRVGAERPLTS